MEGSYQHPYKPLDGKQSFMGAAMAKKLIGTDSSKPTGLTLSQWQVLRGSYNKSKISTSSG